MVITFIIYQQPIRPFLLCRHLSLLCTFILKPNLGSLGAELRSQSLEIIRNMSFLNGCRPALLASEELLYVFKTVLDQDPSDSAKLHVMVSTTIWRLIANNYRAKHVLRAASVSSRLVKLMDRVNSDPELAHGLRDLGYDLALALEVPRALLNN